MIAEDFGPVCTRGQKTREGLPREARAGAASAVRHRHDHRHRGQTSETQELFDADKRPGEKCGLGAAFIALDIPWTCHRIHDWMLVLKARSEAKPRP